MLRIIFLAFLSSFLLPFTSQSPVQGGDGLEPARELVPEGQQWGPVSVLTSVPYKKREDDRDPGYQPLSVLFSSFARRDDEWGPVSGFTSQYYFTHAPNGRRHHTDPPSVITTLVTTTRVLAKQSSTPTSDSNSSPPTTSAVPVPIKTGVNNCNVQGTASTSLTSNILEKSYAADPLSCQLLCMYRSRCESYSFQVPSTSSARNCVFYSSYIDGSSKVVSSSSGIFFSDKYPSDGSNFCYGSSQL